MKESLKLWVEALRSGKYTQGHNQLQSDEGYCCLGVAVRVAMENGVIPNEDTPIEGGTLRSYPKVMEWLGIDHEGSSIIDKNVPCPYIDVQVFDGEFFSLTACNDGHSIIEHSNSKAFDRLTFDQIAEVIESQWKQLLKAGEQQ